MKYTSEPYEIHLSLPPKVTCLGNYKPISPTAKGCGTVLSRKHSYPLRTVFTTLRFCGKAWQLTHLPLVLRILLLRVLFQHFRFWLL